MSSEATAAHLETDVGEVAEATSTVAQGAPGGKVRKKAGKRRGPPPAIRVRNLGKCYHMYRRPEDRLKQALMRGRRQYYKEFWALRGVSFDVRPGQFVGVLGRNGAGKSTLLQMIAGTLTPTEGRVKVRGRVAALLELGSGFSPEFSGRDNVFINGAVLGLNKKEIEKRFDSIAAFADIGEFLEQPVKTYSSGMRMRLAFAVAAHVDASVLLVDEALAVGDAPFRAKCFRRVQQLREQGATVLLATHNMQQVREHCDSALLIDRGHLAMHGEPRDVVQEYYRRFQELDRLETGGGAGAAGGAGNPDAGADPLVDPATLSAGARLGSGGAAITGFNIFDAQGRPARLLTARQRVAFEVRVRFDEDMDMPHVGACLCDESNAMVLGGHTMYADGTTIGAVRAGDVVRCRFEMDLAVNPGKYLLMVGVADHESPESWSDADVYFDLCEVEVVGSKSWGAVNTRVHATVRRAGDSGEDES